MKRGINWSSIIDNMPTECSRGHETVGMINYDRERTDGGISLCLFCPSCHQRLKIRAKRIDSDRWAASGFEVLKDGDLRT